MDQILKNFAKHDQIEFFRRVSISRLLSWNSPAAGVSTQEGH